MKNGGWKIISSFTFILFFLAFFSDFNWENFRTNWINISFGIFAILFFLSQCIFGTKKIKIENDKILIMNSFSSIWKEFKIENLSHICFYKTPIERGSIFPKAIMYPLKNHKGTTIEFKINKKDIYLFLSILQDYGKDVLIFEKLKNINETEYYSPTTDTEIPQLNKPKFTIDFDSQEYQNSIPLNSKRASKLFYFSLSISIVKLFITYEYLIETIFFFNIMAIVFSFGLGMIYKKGAISWTKWIILILCLYFLFECVYFLAIHSIKTSFCIMSIIQFILMLINLMNIKKSKTSNHYSR